MTQITFAPSDSATGSTIARRRLYASGSPSFATRILKLLERAPQVCLGRDRAEEWCAVREKVGVADVSNGVLGSRILAELSHAFRIELECGCH
jgi:hypothetical protein